MVCYSNSKGTEFVCSQLPVYPCPNAPTAKAQEKSPSDTHSTAGTDLSEKSIVRTVISLVVALVLIVAVATKKMATTLREQWPRD